MYFDIHSHIVPGVDDGAANLEQAERLIEMMKLRGADAIAATPHFYAEDVEFDTYSAAVENGFCTLKPIAESLNVRLVKGYEVRYFQNIGRSDILRSLTLGNSDYMLLEFIYGEEITDRMIEDVADIYYNHRITPILAHLERYEKYRGFDKALDLIDEGIALAHINTSSFVDGYKKAALNLVKNGYVHFIASDAHNTDARQPLYPLAFKKLASRLGQDRLDELKDNSARLFEEITAKD